MQHDHAPVSLHAARALAGFTNWIIASAEDLEDAAELLGGPQARALARQITGSVRAGTALPQHLPELRRLLRLLAPQYPDGFGCETEGLAMIDPADPRVDNVDWCLKTLRHGVALLEQSKPRPRSG